MGASCRYRSQRPVARADGRGAAPMKRLILVLLVIPLIFVLAAKDPQGAGHLVQLVIMVGAKLLNAAATIIHDLLQGLAHNPR